MELHKLEEKMAGLEYRLAVLEGTGPTPEPTTQLRIAVEQTIAVLRAWRENKASSLEEDGNDDYRDVISTLPLLEKAFAEWAIAKQDLAVKSARRRKNASV